MEKAPKLPSDISWHFVGHLQSNKAKTLLGEPFHILYTSQSECKQCARVPKILSFLHTQMECQTLRSLKLWTQRRCAFTACNIHRTRHQPVVQEETHAHHLFTGRQVLCTLSQACPVCEMCIFSIFLCFQCQSFTF